jgi:hypothetical protein
LLPRLLTLWGHKVGGHSYTTYIFQHDANHSSASIPVTKKKERKIVDLEKHEVDVELAGSHPSSLSCLIAESSRPASEVTREHLQNLVSGI